MFSVLQPDAHALHRAPIGTRRSPTPGKSIAANSSHADIRRNRHRIQTTRVITVFGAAISRTFARVLGLTGKVIDTHNDGSARCARYVRRRSGRFAACATAHELNQSCLAAAPTKVRPRVAFGPTETERFSFES
jgi:hypothetical protein